MLSGRSAYRAMGFLLTRPPWSWHERSSSRETRHLRGHREWGLWASRVMMLLGWEDLLPAGGG